MFSRGGSLLPSLFMLTRAILMPSSHSEGRDIYALNVGSSAWEPWVHAAMLVVLAVFSSQVGSSVGLLPTPWRRTQWRSRRQRTASQRDSRATTPLLPIGSMAAEADEADEAAGLLGGGGGGGGGTHYDGTDTRGGDGTGAASRLWAAYAWVVQWCIQYSPYVCLFAVTLWAVFFPTWQALLLLLWAHVHWLLPFRHYVLSVRYLLVYTVLLTVFEYSLCIGNWSDAPDWGLKKEDQTTQFLQLGMRILVLLVLATSCRYRNSILLGVGRGEIGASEGGKGGNEAGAGAGAGAGDVPKSSVWSQLLAGKCIAQCASCVFRAERTIQQLSNTSRGGHILNVTPRHIVSYFP